MNTGLSYTLTTVNGDVYRHDLIRVFSSDQKNHPTFYKVESAIHDNIIHLMERCNIIKFIVRKQFMYFRTDKVVSIFIEWHDTTEQPTYDNKEFEEYLDSLE